MLSLSCRIADTRRRGEPSSLLQSFTKFTILRDKLNMFRSLFLTCLLVTCAVAAPTRDARGLGSSMDKQRLQDILAKVPYEDLDTRADARDKQRLQDILTKVPYEDLNVRDGTIINNCSNLRHAE
ncbi:hypothetical protein HOLleu_16619 [Holothuria leucospilota]|uniref:Uncharacterized protein n=1 Tax=Holothuria leucospilota TaxID=206669 RepID=A0A9Q1C4C5_HOLLE|nr:hypothetical protein HOLleu_16619 [Holothuria leucospilota]